LRTVADRRGDRRRPSRGEAADDQIVGTGRRHDQPGAEAPSPDRHGGDLPIGPGQRASQGDEGDSPVGGDHDAVVARRHRRGHVEHALVLLDQRGQSTEQAPRLDDPLRVVRLLGPAQHLPGGDELVAIVPLGSAHRACRRFERLVLRRHLVGRP
jgi:hypothetical protein